MNSTISKWSLRFLIFIVLFTLSGKIVHAENVYFQDDNRGELEYSVGDFTSNSLIIGQVTLSGTTNFTGGQAYFNVWNTSGFCTGSPFVSIKVATTTGTATFYAITDQILPTEDPNTFNAPFTSIGSTAIPAGTYNVYLVISCNFGSGLHVTYDISNTNFYGLISDVGGVSEVLVPDETKFISIVPGDGNTRATSTTNNIYVNLNVKEQDYVSGGYVKLNIRNNAQASYDLVGPSFALGDTNLLPDGVVNLTLNLNDIITSGLNTLSTTTGDFGPAGTYTIYAEYRKPDSTWSNIVSWFNIFGNTDANVITASSTTFVYGTSSAFDILQEGIKESTNQFIASSTTSLQDVKQYCSFSSSFQFTDCITSLFLPNGQDIRNLTIGFKNNIGTHFPLGYLNDFINIVSTTTTGSLTVIDATLPMFGNAHIGLDLSHSIDYVLNATTSQWSNVSASSSETFYQITSRYWNIIIYILTIFYILSRIIGSHLMPNGFGSKGSLSDNSSTDDSYRLKEYLYKHRKK